MKNMKKYIIILAAFFAAALLVPDCNPEYTPGLGSQELKISLFCDEPETKADPEPDPFAFEKVIDHFDFFFFKDAAGTQPISGMHERVNGSEKVLDTREGSDYSALRKGTSYVYILANYPGTIDHATDHTLAELLALPVDDPIITATEKERNPITGDMEETGNVTYCNSLVMDSYQKATDTAPETYLTKLTPQEIEEERTVTIKLSRLAAKLALIINVEPSVPGSMTYTEGGTTRQEEWTPVLKDLHAYFVNALNNKSTVKGNPVERDTIQVAPESYEYLTYPTLYPLTADASDDHKFTSAPAYTYPQEWADTANGEPYFKIQIPWESSLRGSSTFYYKIALPKSESNKRTLNRNMFYQVTVDLAVVDTENEYVELNASYVVTPWLPSFGMGKYDPGSAKFFNVPVTTFDTYSQESVSAPFYSSSATKAYFTEISYYYYGDGAGSQYTYTYTETDNQTSVTLHNASSSTPPKAAKDLNEYKLVREGNSWKLTHSLDKIYTVRTIKFVIKNDDGKLETVTVRQHPALELESMATNNFFVNGHFARATEGIHVPGKPGVVVGVPFTTKRSEIGVTRYHSDDNRWTGSAANNTSNTDNTTTYWYPGASDYGTSTSFGAAPSVQCNISNGRYGWVVGDGYGNGTGHNHNAPYLIKLTVSAFNADNNTYTYRQDDVTVEPKTYILGDPRVEGGSLFSELANVSGTGNKGAYLYKPSTVRSSDDPTTIPAGTSAAVYKAWTEPEKIMTTSPDRNNGQIIAPRILLSSYYNGQPAALNFTNARKRAATYQEAGYPAGRWRLPTEAEIMFLVWCQQQGIISPVWANGSSYWCADGRYVTIANGGDYVTFHESNSSTTVVNRFVYDLWYWGDKPMNDQEQFWPNGHLAKPNDITGSTFPSID